VTTGERFMDWTFDHIMPWLVGGAIVFLVIFIAAAPFAIYADSKAERFSLKKDEWVCSASVERAETVYVNSGKVGVPVTTYSKHCTQWSEKP